MSFLPYSSQILPTQINILSSSQRSPKTKDKIKTHKQKIQREKIIQLNCKKTKSTHKPEVCFVLANYSCPVVTRVVGILSVTPLAKADILFLSSCHLQIITRFWLRLCFHFCYCRLYDVIASVSSYGH